MTTYKTIRGTHIVSVTSDPPAPVNGQMWYNSTTQTLKGFTSNPAGTWATSTALNNARGAGSTAGTNASAWFVGGETNPPPGTPSNWSVKNELWNGSSWSESNDLTRPGFYSGMGSRGVPNNTTGLVFGGHQGSDPATQYAQTEEWNGSSWTEVADLNTGRRGGGGAGTSAEACLCFGGGYGNPFSDRGETESWNGSSWTEVNDLNNARYGRASFGSYTSALYAGDSDSKVFVETWNGTSWTETTDHSTTGKDGGSGVVNTSGLIFGGHPTGNTEVWNGSTWTETGNFNVARPSASGAGASAASAIIAGGYNPSPGAYVTNAEEFISPTTSTVTFTVS